MFCEESQRASAISKAVQLIDSFEGIEADEPFAEDEMSPSTFCLDLIKQKKKISQSYSINTRALLISLLLLLFLNDRTV